MENGGVENAPLVDVPTELGVHLVMCNYSTHKTFSIKAWFARHPRSHVHFTSTSVSWLNQVERWFASYIFASIERFCLRVSNLRH